MKTRLLSLATILCAFGAFNVQAETVADALEKCRNTDNSLKPVSYTHLRAHET